MTKYFNSFFKNTDSLAKTLVKVWLLGIAGIAFFGLFMAVVWVGYEIMTIDFVNNAVAGIIVGFFIPVMLGFTILSYE